MGLFTKDELDVLDLIASNKRLSDTDKEHLPALKAKLGTVGNAPLLAQFVNLTGWTNRPKDYPQ
jgi:hypothetical protein